MIRKDKLDFGLKRKEVVFYFLIMVLFFADVLKNGNLNLLYFFGVYVIVFESINKSFYYKELAKLFIPFVAIPAIFVIFSGSTLHVLRACVYCAKIFINISLLYYFKINLCKMNIGKIWRGLAIIYTVFLILALLTYEKTPLWRINDVYNSFSKTRLQFLFSEPSVLGLLTGLVLIFIVFSIIEDGMTVKRGIMLAVFMLTLILTFSMSGIVYFAIAMIYYFVVKFVFNNGRLNRRVTLVVSIAVLLAIIVLITNNPISNRLMAILQGNDASFNFRWNASSNSLLQIMGKTHNWGLGLGNMNTGQGLSILRSVGIDYKFANSFQYFIAENGLLGAAYILYLFALCFKECVTEKKRNSNIYQFKIMLLILVFVSQIAGGYFTDPLLWCIYGIISAHDVDQKTLYV